jgi:outer membrane protein OmpA-like peptidoglycan-associated protein
MKILIIGFLTLFSWSALSTYIYVCKINGFCGERETVMIEKIRVNDAFTSDSLPESLVPQQSKVQEPQIIYFEFDKSALTSDAQTDGYSGESKEYLNNHVQSRLIITGHTDAIGSDEYNQALGYRRAKSVKHYFENKGIGGDLIIIESEGENKPAESNSTTDGREKNRRAVVTIKN